MHLARFVLVTSALATLLVAGWSTGCGGGSPVPATSTPVSAGGPPVAASTAARPAAPTAPSRPQPPPPQDPVVVLHTTAGDIQLQLFAEKAPQTVNNFLATYASRGFYEQTIFHHLEPGAMLIGGGYTADLEPKPVRTPIFNESRNGLSNRRGMVAMIHEPDSPHSATSQFFINLADNPELDFQADQAEDAFGYCVFGEVIAGLDVVDRIAQMPTAASGEFAKVPSPAVSIQSIQRLR
jgi:peptidyl-prolyl cis-trans isomerase A (cyclophilin A)